jgi:tRNA pseudouridine38-40 synthase
MLQSLLMTISYDGTDFFGWYCPNNRNLKNTLEKALDLPLYQILIASRTDKGVHAEDQKVVLQFELKFSHLLPDLLTINSRLPEDLRVLSLENCRLDFHPSLEAKSKEYRYHFHVGEKHPHFERYSLSIKPIDIEKIHMALPFFLGRNNFKAFEGSHHQRQDPFCTIEEILFEQIATDRYLFTIRGNRFLYLMCRKIAGTLLYYGYGKLSLTPLKKGLEELCPKEVGPTLSPKGLLLKKIHYDRNPAFIV